MESAAPTVQESVRVNARTETCEVLIVNLWSWYRIEVRIFLRSLMMLDDV
jgi:hypothetical protein